MKNTNQLILTRTLLDGMLGHNYALPDCIKYIFECMNEHQELDFRTIAGITGDTATQVYNHNPSTRCEYCVSGYLAGKAYVTSVFDALGYDCEYAENEQIASNK